MFTALWEAIDQKNYPKFKKLISEYSEEEIEQLGHDLNLLTPIDQQRAQILFCMACECGFLKIIEFLIDNPIIDVNASDSYGDTPLYSACRIGKTKVVEQLLKSPHIEVNKKHSTENSTPLRMACSESYFDIIKLLIKHPETNIYDLSNMQDDTLLNWAIEKGYEEIITLVLAHPKLEIHKGEPLYFAICTQNLKLVKLLPASVNPDKSSILYEACKRENLDIVKHLIEDRKANVNMASRIEDNNTPFIGACIHGNLNIVKYLLNNSNVNINQPNKNNETPLKVAYNKKRENIFQYLISNPRFILDYNDLFVFFPYLIKNNDESFAKLFMLGLRIRGIFKEIIGIINTMYEGNSPSDKLTSDFWKSVCISAGCTADDKSKPHITQSALELNRIFWGKDISMVFIITILLCDDYVKLKIPNNATTENQIRFFKSMLKLPIELQMLVCNLLFESGKKLVSAEDSTEAAKLVLNNPKFFSKSIS